MIKSICAQVNLRNVGRQKYARLDIESDQLQVVFTYSELFRL